MTYRNFNIIYLYLKQHVLIHFKHASVELSIDVLQYVFVIAINNASTRLYHSATECLASSSRVARKLSSQRPYAQTTKCILPECLVVNQCNPISAHADGHLVEQISNTNDQPEDKPTNPSQQIPAIGQVHTASVKHYHALYRGNVRLIHPDWLQLVLLGSVSLLIQQE